MVRMRRELCHFPSMTVKSGSLFVTAIVSRRVAVCGSTAEVAPDDGAVLVRRQFGKVDGSTRGNGAQSSNAEVQMRCGCDDEK